MKKVKMQESVIYQNYAYHNFKRTSLVSETGKKVYATLFWLDKGLTKEDKKELHSKYNNIQFYTSRKQYAPEITSDCILVADRVLS